MAKLLGLSHTDDVTLTVTSEVTDFEIENLQNTQPSQPWRSTTNGVQTISWSHSSSKLYDSFVLYGHNLLGGDEVKFQLSNDAGFAVIEYEYIVDAGTVLYGLGLGPLGISPVGLGGYLVTGNQSRVPVIAHFFDTVFAKYGRIILTHNAATLSYIQAARLKAGFSITTAFNVDTGYEVGYPLPDETIETYSNALYVLSRPKYREAVLTWSFLSFSNALEVQNLIFNIGSHMDIFVSPYYFETSSRSRLSEILGRIQNVTKIKEVISGPTETSKYKFSMLIREGL